MCGETMLSIERRSKSILQPTLGLRWLLCYEEADAEICHLQKAAPKYWFKAGERIISGALPNPLRYSWVEDRIAF